MLDELPRVTLGLLEVAGGARDGDRGIESPRIVRLELERLAQLLPACEA
ncbi:MAG: hypothetical protein JO184_16205 [Gammaproteobacteria bacterium]|nr:hypothetical protein [Gammaproteobacteria bacterium]MBV8308272.1 hypothetical protein [Gammaproteobacteria bacterium]